MEATRVTRFAVLGLLAVLATQCSSEFRLHLRPTNVCNSVVSRVGVPASGRCQARVETGKHSRYIATPMLLILILASWPPSLTCDTGSIRSQRRPFDACLCARLAHRCSRAGGVAAKEVCPKYPHYRTYDYPHAYDGWEYSIYDADAIGLLSYGEASKFCKCKGLELAPWDEKCSWGA